MTGPIPPPTPAFPRFGVDNSLLLSTEPIFEEDISIEWSEPPTPKAQRIHSTIAADSSANFSGSRSTQINQTIGRDRADGDSESGTEKAARMDQRDDDLRSLDPEVLIGRGESVNSIDPISNTAGPSRWMSKRDVSPNISSSTIDAEISRVQLAWKSHPPGPSRSTQRESTASPLTLPKDHYTSQASAGPLLFKPRGTALSRHLAKASSHVPQPKHSATTSLIATSTPTVPFSSTSPRPNFAYPSSSTTITQLASPEFAREAGRPLDDLTSPRSLRRDGIPSTHSPLIEAMSSFSPTFSPPSLPSSRALLSPRERAALQLETTPAIDQPLSSARRSVLSQREEIHLEENGQSEAVQSGGEKRNEPSMLEGVDGLNHQVKVDGMEMDRHEDEVPLPTLVELSDGERSDHGDISTISTEEKSNLKRSRSEGLINFFTDFLRGSTSSAPSTSLANSASTSTTKITDTTDVQAQSGSSTSMSNSHGAVSNQTSAGKRQLEDQRPEESSKRKKTVEEMATKKPSRPDPPGFSTLTRPVKPIPRAPLQSRPTTTNIPSTFASHSTTAALIKKPPVPKPSTSTRPIASTRRIAPTRPITSARPAISRPATARPASTSAFARAALAKLPPPGKGATNASHPVTIKTPERARDMAKRRKIFEGTSSISDPPTTIPSRPSIQSDRNTTSKTTTSGIIRTMPVIGRTPGKASRARAEQRHQFDEAVRERNEAKERQRAEEERKRIEEEEEAYVQSRKETVVWAKPVPEMYRQSKV